MSNAATITSGTFEAGQASDYWFRYVWDCSAVLDESALTGESHPVAKSPEPVTDPAALAANAAASGAPPRATLLYDASRPRSRRVQENLAGWIAAAETRRLEVPGLTEK